MQPLKRNLLSMALASAALMLANGAHAQAAGTQDNTTQQNADDAKELDTIEVTGIRRSIEASTEAKRQSTSIVETVSAEDIGKLPDTSIADSLARLPGLTAQRFGGRPQEINIRGFSGDFSTTTLNGREQVSLGNNRGVEFDQYPSELVSQVMVYKTPDAQLVGQGLSATVDLRTVRPLAFGKQAFAVNLRGDQNRVGDEKENGYRASVSYIDQFADNTIGIALGYAHLNNPGQSKQFGDTWGYDGNGVFGGGKLYDLENDNERDGLMGVLEYQPNDSYHMVLDVFYSKFDKEERKRGMEFGAAFGATTAPGSTTQNASFSNVNPVIRNDFNATYDDLFAIGWRHDLELNEHWTASADIGYSSATREERILETYSGLANGARDTLTMRLDPDGFYDHDFGFDYGDASILRLGDPGGWGQDGYIKDFEVKDSLTSVRFDLERSFDQGWLSSIKFGANLTDRNKSRASNEAFLDLTACLPPATSACDANGFTGMPTQFASSSGFNAYGVPSIYAYDALRAYQSLYTRRANANNSDISNKNWDVNEQVTTAYVQANINTDIGSVSVKGNIGVQLVAVDQSSRGSETFLGNGIGRRREEGTTYSDVLPSLNLSFGFGWDQVVRVAAARQVARPRMDDLRANNRIDIEVDRLVNPITGQANQIDPNTGQLQRWWRRDGGNPNLNPWLADAFDISYEKYFADNKGYVGAAYFYKNLKTYIYNETSLFNINDTVVTPADYPTNPLLVPPNPVGAYTRPENGEGGVLKGWEVTASVPLDILWAPLEGFGFVASYAETTSDIQPQGPGSSQPLPGLSKYVSSMTVYYDRYGFSARVASRTRSDFFGEVQGFGGDRARRTFEGERVTDLQLGYTFQRGPLQNVSLLLQVNNLENEPFTSSFDGRDDRPREYFEYGRTYLLGVNYRF